MASLEEKGYIKREGRSRRGSYSVLVVGYFKGAHTCTQVASQRMGMHSQVHDGALLKIQEGEEQIEEAQQTPLRVYPRSIRESKAKAEALVGQGPTGGRIKPEVLKRIIGKGA